MATHPELGMSHETPHENKYRGRQYRGRQRLQGRGEMMSKNAQRKRREKAKHRDQFSPVPRGTPLAFFIRNVEPVSTPLMEMLRRNG
jgi:hypothetical protein